MTSELASRRASNSSPQLFLRAICCIHLLRLGGPVASGSLGLTTDGEIIQEVSNVLTLKTSVTFIQCMFLHSEF